MNQKGIVLSSLVYALLVFFFLLLISLLMILWYRQNAINNLGKDANDLYDLLPIPFTTDFDYTKGVNTPKLATGMTPIKWDGSAWVDTTEKDINWYDYKTDVKKWANVKTEDGSMWVWIPRYAYQISSGYHTNTVGTINIKFLIDQTNTTSDGTAISTTPAYSESSQTNYIVHPAFTFGTTVLTGVWVAKFEASGTTSAVDFKPNAASLRSPTISDMFTATRNMETNNRYGWGLASGLNTDGTFTTDTNNVDTHMMKNVEWGVVAYLSKSTYGQNTNEIWINPASDSTTGCAGSSTSSSTTTGCINAYNTTDGVKASTTGNIYGIYDISGGAWEHTSAYVNNGDVSLSTYGNSILNADAKYKDIYIIGTDDGGILNYEANISMGDAVYETSNDGESSSSWFADMSYMPNTSNPWFARGGDYSGSTDAGAFHFSFSDGASYGYTSFRSVVLVGEGL